MAKENENFNDKKPFIDKIISENIKLKNDYNFYRSQFTTFINKITEKIKFEIIDEKANQQAITKYIPTLKILNDWIVIWSTKEIDINEYEDN